MTFSAVSSTRDGAPCAKAPWLSFLLLTLLPLSLPARATAAQNARPNFVLCMADDQGYGDVGFRDHRVLKTPVLDELADSCLRFDRFYAAAPVCSPTRGSVLTGRHPNRFGCFSWGYTLRPQEVTLAEALSAAGYATGHFGKWHLGPVRASSSVCPGNSGFDTWFSSPNFYENSPQMSRNGKVVQSTGESSQVTVDEALKFIRRAAGRENPFLAVVWFGSPHGPHVALPEDREIYRDLPERLQHFYGEITAMDRAVGRLRRELRELGIADNTLLWYTSDNGALQVGSAGGLKGNKGSLWEGGLRVPAMIEWPSHITSPRSTAVPCGTVDILPTLLDIAGVDQPTVPLDGISLLPLIEGAAEPRTKPLGFWVYPAKGRPVRSDALLTQLAQEQAAGNEAPAASDVAFPPGEIKTRYSESERPGHAAWLDGRYKLHRIPRTAGQFDYQIYDIEHDPAETTDIADREPTRLARMRAELEQWQKSVVKSLNGEDYVAGDHRGND